MRQKREIKFRAWIPDLKEITYDNFTVDSNGEVYTLNGDFLEGAILMQYTGLKDKNGTEIYEGDIVSTTTRFMEHYTTHIKKIIWASKGGFHAEGTTCDNLTEFITDTSGRNISEVIGNIHENPELLNN